MKTIRLFLYLLVVVLLLISCDGVVTPEEDVPTNLEINQFEDGKIELSWTYYNSSSSNDTLDFYIAKKTGNSLWNDYYRVVNEATTSIIDHIPTDDSLVYAYRVRFFNRTKEEFSNFSDAVAYLSENTVPTDLASEQLSQQELQITWIDRCVGEEGYRIDRKNGSENWQTNYEMLPADATEFIDEVTLYDTLFYRVFIYFGKSISNALEDSVFNSLAAPSDLQGLVLDQNKIRLTWTDNSTGEEGFYVDRKVGFLDWEAEYATVDSNDTTFVDDITFPAATLQYRVRAYESIYTSNQSNIDTTNVHLDVVGSTPTPGDALEVFNPAWTAFVADNYAGLTVVDCQNPSNPLLAYSISDSILPDRTLSSHVVGNIAYVASHNGIGMQGQLSMVDIISAGNPNLISFIPTVGIPKDLFVYYDFVYVAEGDHGLSIFYAGSFLALESNYSMSDAREVYLYDHYAFVANGLDGMQIIDILDAGSPQFVSEVSSTGLCNDVHVENNYAFMADGEDGLKIVDVSDVSIPFEVAQLETGGFAYGVFAEGDYAYLIDKETGFYVIDVSNPVSPYVMGYLAMDTDPVSIHLSGSYVYITDNEGLKIVQVKP